MTHSEFKIPTDEEVRDHLRGAHKLRAEAFATMFRSAAQWLAHPRFGFSHA